ncbi:hypothetical protein AALO_G00185240 [Alosa alosa]|uniref:Uncharacterized protein n=1 Tax=Alosa alosa TaxID=278164 RepID=A0AAV6GEE5_9TELE|nr:hypothetical protein AALO_G00185240 [Alosa alosa]
MASQGSFNWFRAETVISINHSVRLLGVIPSRDLCVILNGAQPNTEYCIPALLMEFLQRSGDYCHAQHLIA